MLVHMLMVLFHTAEAADSGIDRNDSFESDRVVEPTRAPRVRTSGGDATPAEACAGTARERHVIQDGWIALGGEGGVLWTLDYTAVFGTARISWTETVTPGSHRLTVPPEAIVSALQREWLTGVHVVAKASSREGRQVEVRTMDPISFVVVDDSEIRWLDANAVEREAPSGAWSASARASIAEYERDGVWVVAPYRGGEQ